MPKIATYCRICEAACGLIADTDGPRLTLHPDPAHVVSQGFVCSKGVHFDQVHDDPDRVDAPLLRRAGRLSTASWSDALVSAGAELKRIREAHGPHSVGMYIGNPSAFSPLTTLFGLAFVKALGTRNYFNAGSLDCNNKFVVAREMLGSPASHPVPDLDRAQFALLVGTNPSVSQSSFINAPRMVERLKRIEERGGKVYSVDPRRTETSKVVGSWIAIRPGSDAALLLGMIHVILRDGLDHAIRVARFTRGVEDLRSKTQAFCPRRVHELTGIDPGQVEALAREFAQADGAFCHISTGVNQGGGGNLSYAAKIALEAITGNLDQRGGTLFPEGAIDTASWAARLGADREPTWKSRIGGHSPVLGALPCSILPDEILTPGPEQVRALVVLAGNPLLSAPDSGRLLEAFKQLEYLVVIDLFVNDTASLADAVLPCTDWLEREDAPLTQLQLQPTPYVQWTPAVTQAKAERRHDWQILLDLAAHSGVQLGGARLIDASLRGALKLAGPRGLLLAPLLTALGRAPMTTLARHPHGLLLPPAVPGAFLGRRIRTASRRVELCPAAVYAQLPLLEQLPRPAAGQLLVFSKRQRLGHNSWLHNNPGLNPGAMRAHISPGDADELGLRSDDWVSLTSSAGRLELQVKVDPDVARGGIAIPHGYGHSEQSGWREARRRGGANVNTLAASGPGAADPLSGMTHFNGICVSIERLAATDRASPGPQREPVSA